MKIFISALIAVEELLYTQRALLLVFIIMVIYGSI
jgi:hypothetical protein